MTIAPLFSGARLRTLAWEAEYGPELAIDAPDGSDDAQVDLDVETPGSAWRPIRAMPGARPARVAFVDGVRSVDQRVVGTRGDRLFHGLFGSYAVGSVLLGDGAAHLVRQDVARRLVLGSGETLPAPVTIAPALVYAPLSTAEHEPDAPLRGLQSDMRRAEEELARAEVEAERGLVVVDGPLTFESRAGAAVVGYIKRVHDLYLPQDRLGFLASLPAGARTPLFALRGSKRFARYAWFLRLAPPPPGSADLFGLARLEVVSSIGVDAARALADATAALLPGLAPARGRDPRSPQNLLPIGGLEARLRQALGDRRVVRAQIERAIAQEAMHAQ